LAIGVHLCYEFRVHADISPQMEWIFSFALDLSVEMPMMDALAQALKD
jgi:hypothetical protein